MNSLWWTGEWCVCRGAAVVLESWHNAGTCTASYYNTTCRAFEEYWWANYIVTVAQLQVFLHIQYEPAVPTWCRWYLRIVQHNTQQLTCRHCKFSVAPMLTWISQNSSTVSPLVVSQVCLQVVRPLQTAPLSQQVLGSIHLYHMCLHIHLPVFVDNLHGRQWVALILAVQVSWRSSTWSTSLYQNTWDHLRTCTDLGNMCVTNAVVFASSHSKTALMIDNDNNSRKIKIH